MVLTDRSTGNKVRILRQNAEQILGIVKETFTGHSFDGRSCETDCAGNGSDGELLGCLWSKAAGTSLASEQSKNTTAIAALTEVTPRPRVVIVES